MERAKTNPSLLEDDALDLDTVDTIIKFKWF